jgi:hypothetical protein
MFDQGVELKEILMALQIPPEEVRRLFREWQSSLGVAAEGKAT